MARTRLTPKHRLACVALTALLVVPAFVGAKPPPKSIEQLRTTSFDPTLTLERVIDAGQPYRAEVYSYRSGKLKVGALVATPLDAAGELPVIVANHGHHPEPQNYGKTAAGHDRRPGDYYREIPARFVAHGFIVVMPDYRGHNDSEGFEFTEGLLEASYYAEDVATLAAGLDQIPFADPNNVFMWGHSMGGEVTLRALLIVPNVRAATLWSSVGGDIWDQAYYYSRYLDPYRPDSSKNKKNVVHRLRGRLESLESDYDTRDNEPLLFLQHLQTPVIIHHAIDDSGAAYKWSVELAQELDLHGKAYDFYSYDGSDHLFKGQQLTDAIQRDVTFFRAMMQER